MFRSLCLVALLLPSAAHAADDWTALSQAYKQVEHLNDDSDHHQEESDARWRWVEAYNHAFGKDAAVQARACLADSTLAALQHALCLRVFTDKTLLPREEALALYRPYLASPYPELRQEAVLMAIAYYDSQMQPEIKRLEDDPDDLEVRSQAWWLLRLFLLYGPEERKRSYARIGSSWVPPYDEKGYQEWGAHLKDWKEENTRIWDRQHGARTSVNQ